MNDERARLIKLIAQAEQEAARWQQACAPVTDAWIGAMRERGIDGGGLVEKARALVARLGQGVA